MRISNGAGAGGVGSATEPGPTAVNVKAEQMVYANNNPAPQAHFDDDAPPSFERMLEAAGTTVVPPDVPNAPDAATEDESLLHSLDRPDPNSLPRVSAEVLQAKRKLVIKGMKVDRTHSREAVEIFAEISALERDGVDFWEAARQVIKPVPAAPSAAPIGLHAVERPPPSPPPRSRKRTKTTIPLDAATRAMLLQIQDSELRFLMRLYQAWQRERGEPFISQADMLHQYGVNRDTLYETDAVGRMIGFTVEYDEFIGHNAIGRGATTYKRKGQFVTIPPEQFLKRITPGSETPAQTQARRAKSKRQYRSERERQRTAKSRAATKARRRRVNDLDCRASAIKDILIPGKWTTIKRVARDLEKSAAFDGLTGESLHRAIERELAKEPLSNMIQQKKKATARLGFSTKMFRLK
jgi:hypothetical protein